MGSSCYCLIYFVSVSGMAQAQGRGNMAQGLGEGNVWSWDSLAGVGGPAVLAESLPCEASFLVSEMGTVSNCVQTKPKGFCEAHMGSLCPISAQWTGGLEQGQGAAPRGNQGEWAGGPSWVTRCAWGAAPPPYSERPGYL